LSRSQIYRNFARAFNKASNLPLVFRPSDGWNLAQRGQRNENPFCALMAGSHSACAECLEIQNRIGNPHSVQTRSATCFAGLCETAVPVKIGKRVVGFLQTGQVSLKPLSRLGFSKIAARIAPRDGGVDLQRLKDAYFQSRVLSAQQYAGFIAMLEIFARHLGSLGNQLVIQNSQAESPLAARAKTYITSHLGDPIRLKDAARALHLSTFYFCKVFKKSTGLTFTEYLGRVRIERAKTLLLNPNKRVSEIAYEAGFTSLTHFNRLFSRMVGKSPSAYRRTLLPA